MPEPTDQPEYESVRILRLQPGDTIVVRVDQYLTRSQSEDIKAYIRQMHPDHQVLVLGPNVDLEIMRDGDDA